ncbi:MAG: BON domain-containing protein [Candidatus Dormibacteraeota bacterium]|nr:BON domain-containing protein [Candidatus Dormibacteraeota bacterium]
MARILDAVRVSGRERHPQDDDADTTALVRQALVVAFGPVAESMLLRVDRGILTMRGEVDHIDDIEAYAYVARQVPGVVDVDNLLRLRLTGHLRPHILSA